MADSKDTTHLKSCFEEMIILVQESAKKLRPSHDGQEPNKLRTTAALNTGAFTFAINSADEEEINTLKENLENSIDKNRVRLSKLSQRYLLELLQQYHYNIEDKKFTSSFTMENLYPFEFALQGAQASIDAFYAAWDGKKKDVKSFLEKYPTYKNKPGLHGTTLLFSAAKNNHQQLVEYLVNVAGCDVNAQNLQDLEKALNPVTGTGEGFDGNPSAASTALHGACYNGHLEIVKYLIKNGADYFLLNQAQETPIENGRNNNAIRQFFESFLILGYSQNKRLLPKQPTQERLPDAKFDCIWEYKPLSNEEWTSFLPSDSEELSQSLIVPPDQEMKREIFLKSAQTDLLAVSLIQFLITGKSRDPKKGSSWVRCRGSSIENFDCYGVWQIMLTKHPDHQSNDEPCLTPFNLPVTYDSQFRFQLNSWYNCTTQLNSKLGQAINYRRKVICFSVDEIASDELACDLQAFSFTNEKRTISGFIRWIPKLISKKAKELGRIQLIDNFQNLANLDPIPFTTKDEAVKPQRIGQQSSTTEDEFLGENDVDIPVSQTLLNVDEGDDDNYDVNKKGGSSNQDRSSPIRGVSTEHDDDNRSIASEDNQSDVLDDYLVDAASLASSVSASVIEAMSTVYQAEIEAIKVDLMRGEKEKKRLEDELKLANQEKERYLADSKRKTAEKEAAYNALLEKIKKMNDEMQKIQSEKDDAQKIEQAIKVVDYKEIQVEVVQDFLTPNFNEIISHLKRIKVKFTAHVADKILKMSFSKKSNLYTVTIVGFQEHQEEFKMILKRIRGVLNLNGGAKRFYQIKLNKLTNLVKRNLSEVHDRTQLWKQYMKSFNNFLQEKSNEYQNMFEDYLKEKMSVIAKQCICTDVPKIRTEIHTHTNNFMASNNLLNEIESIKLKALEEFIEDNITKQRNQLENKPTAKAISTLDHFIDKVRIVLKTDRNYLGHKVENFNMIPGLLRRLIVYYSCFKLQLPLYEAARELLSKIEQNTITTIATSTGSGKSTLLPALLAAEGYDKIFVTQPRRLPCMLISNRVNETTTVAKDKNTQKLAGWAVSGAENNQDAKVLYLTDGLLKERLLYDEKFITNDAKLNKSVVFFIDEVHERSVNIDHCLALLARMLNLNPRLKSRLKLIISSATLDTSVPQLFSKIPGVEFSKYEMPQMGTLYPVQEVARPNFNILNLVQELYQEKKRHDQILCFVSSVKEVNEYCALLKTITNGAIVAYPLVQSQQASVQQEYIDNGCVFFSTTVAETSLTFPHLKFVIDTGMINVPVYDPESKRTTLRAERAAESTIKQRLGRLGRTRPGTYYSLYNFRVEDKKYPTPQICQSDLMNIEFSLRKSPLQKGLEYFKDFLPDKPSSNIISQTVNQLRALDILEKAPSEAFTSHGKALTKLPDFGSLAMSKCVLAALKEYRCGHDMIALSSILSVLNTTAVLKGIPKEFKSPDGDFMTLFNVMEQVLLVRESVPAKEFHLERLCQAKGLTSIQHIIKQALRRQTNLERSFSASPDYHKEAQNKANDWELLAKSLLAGYSSNVFASLKELQDRSFQYTRYHGSNDNEVAELDSQSTLKRGANQVPPALILARDIRYSTSIRSKAILSFVGEIKPEWVEYSITRELKLNNEEEKRLNSNNIFTGAVSKFSHRINMQLNGANKAAIMTGPAGSVFHAELHLRQNMIEDFQFQLENKNAVGTTAHTNLSRNLESILKMPNIFRPMIWRWENQKQVKIVVNCNTSTNTCDITVTGRNSDYQAVRREFDTFSKWLQECAVIRHPNSGVPPRVLGPQVRSKYRDVEERIARITDTKRTPIDLYNGAKSLQATRETRMEVVAWIAVCLFSCKLEGGFVRDWVIGKYTATPQNPPSNPSTWVSVRNSLPCLNKEVVPADLDCHLPTHYYFDIERFRDELFKYDITCKVFRQDWRYVLLIDENAPRGPFTMDLIEPHVALTHDRIDFDVNNLYLEKDYTHELGMRVDIQQRPYCIELETIVENIKNKRFQVLRPIDHFLTERIEKMEKRKWTQIGQPFTVIPNPNPKYSSVLVPLPQTTKLYQDLVQQMRSTIGNSLQMISIEQVKNPLIEDAYESMKKIIARQCPGFNPNERLLFHGTHGPGIDGIRDDGFDDRYYSAGGNWGHGAYFADNPVKSHGYTRPDPTNQTRVMYYSKVLLGIESNQGNTTDTKLVSAPKDTHSVTGSLGFNEYIVYRYGQALPYLKMVYKA